MDPREIAEENCQYLKTCTSYYSKSQIVSFIAKTNFEYKFCELEAARYSRLRVVYPLLKMMPFAAQILSALQTRVLFLRK